MTVGFYLWVTEIETYGPQSHLVGLAFDGTGIGVATTNLDVLHEPIWIVTETGSKRLSVELMAHHLSRHGWLLCVDGEFSLPLPCLLTSNSAMCCLFRGQVEARLEGTSMELAELVESGIPIVGDDWLGVMSLNSGIYSLIAFGDGLPPSGDEWRAYYADWHDPDGDPDEPYLILRPVTAGQP